MSREFEVKRRDYEEKEGEKQDVPGATDRRRKYEGEM